MPRAKPIGWVIRVSLRRTPRGVIGERTPPATRRIDIRICQNACPPSAGVSMMIRSFRAVCLAVAAALFALPALAQVKVGSKNFTEQFVVAEIYAQALEAAGIKVERKLNLGGTLIAHKALEEKQIDLYPEYTGTMLLVVLKGEPMTDQKAVYDKVKSEYAAKGFVVLNEAPLNNTYNM